MADYIDREELLKYAVGLEENEKVVFEDVIEDMPSVDAVDVVRCKDCKFYADDYLCCKSGVCVENDFFCKWGEKE